MHDRTAAGYDAVAREYAARLFHELDGKPFDREFLLAFERGTPPGLLLDLGCGPGHVAAFMAGLGRQVVGIDLSTAMVAVARELSPRIEFQQGDLCALGFANGSCAGVIAFYCLIHLSTDEIAIAAREIHRVLAPGGRVALAFHVGDEVHHVDTLWGIPTDLDFHFLQPAAVEAALVAAGLRVVQRHTRPPYAPEVEAQTTRCYLVAERGVAGA
jgi:SAM-dependent methyltransferase